MGWKAYIVKMTVLSKLIYRFNVISHKNLKRSQQADHTMYMKIQRTLNNKKIF